MTHELLQGALPAMSVEARIRLYRVKAEQLGAPTNQPIRWLESQASRYRPALLRELGVLKDGAIKLPMTFLRDSKGIAHPALHLLAIDIMFGSLAAYQAEATLLVAEMQRQAELDLIKTLRQHEYDLVAASAAMSRSAQSVVDELIESGVDVTQQFHMFDERRQKLISSGLSAGIAVNRIATLAGVNKEAVYVRQRTHAAIDGRRKKQFVLQRQQRRATFEAMRESTMPLASLRMDGHSYDKLYAWLKKHDAKWLSTTLLRTKKATRSRKRSGARPLLGELTKRRAIFEVMRVSEAKLFSATAEGYRYSTLFSWLRKHDVEWFSKTMRETEIVRSTRRTEARREQYRVARTSLAHATKPTEAMQDRRRNLRRRLLSEDATWLGKFEESLKRESERNRTLMRDERRAAFKSLRDSASTLTAPQLGSLSYAALTHWLKRNDAKWFADATRESGRVASRIRRLIPERRAEFQALRASPRPLRSSTLGGRYPTLYNWLKQHDSVWLDSVMRQSQGRRKPRGRKT